MNIEKVIKGTNTIIAEAEKKFCKKSTDVKELQFICEQCKEKTFSSIGAMEHKRLYKNHDMKVVYER